MPPAQPAASSTIKGWIPAALALLVPLLMAGLLSWHSLGGLDIWLHHTVGQEILTGQGFPRTNSFSFSEPDHPWINHEWLFQVLVALTGSNDQEGSLDQAVAGWNLLRLALTLLLMGTLVLGDGNLGGLGNRRLKGNLRPWLGLPLLLGLLLLWPRLVLRPELVSYLFLVLLVQTLDGPLATWTPTGRLSDLWHPRRPLGRALLLTLLWSQFHGFSSLAPLVWLLAVLAGWLRRWTGTDPRPQALPAGSWWLLSLPLLLLALCLTPNGWQGLVYPLRALGQFRGQGAQLQDTISELVPLLQTRSSLGLTMLAFKISLLAGALRVLATWGRLSPLRALLWALAAVAAYQSQRNVGLYALTFMLLFTVPPVNGARQGLRLFRRLPSVKLPSPWPSLLSWTTLLLTLLLGGIWGQTLLGNDFYLREGVSRRFGGGATPGRFPVESARLLAEAGPLRLFTNIDAAAFLLDHTSARLFIDGRTEAYSTATWQRYNDLKRADEAALDHLEAMDCERVFLTTASQVFRPLAGVLLEHPDWRLDHCEAAGLLFSRRPDRPRPDCQPDWEALTAATSQGPGKLSGDARQADLLLAWSNTLSVLQNEPRLERALQLGLENRADHPQLQHNLGNFLMAAGNPGRALSLFEGALATNPRLAGSALNAGVCCMHLNQPRRAVEFFHRAVALEPGNYQAWANLATAQVKVGNREKARLAMERALQLKPGDPRLQEALRRLRH